MTLVELDLDVAVLRPDGSAIVVGHVDAADRHPDIVDQRSELLGRDDLADRLLDVGKMVGVFLNAGADLAAGVHEDLAGIHGRKEVAAQERRQGERGHHEGEKAGHEHAAAGERHGQELAIAEPDPFEARLEAALKAHQRVARRRRRAVEPVQVGMRRMLAQQVVRHRRHERAREDERARHGGHHRLGHRHEQEPRHALQEEHRHEHDADAQQRDEGRRHDLGGAVHDGGLDLLALLEVPVDVLDRHRGVVDQNADRKREPAQRHDVQRLAEGRERGDRSENREWN
jgi:hypothetical protein